MAMFISHRCCMSEGNATGQTGAGTWGYCCLGGCMSGQGWSCPVQAPRGGVGMEEILDQRASRASGQQVVTVFAPLLPYLLHQLEFLCGLLFQLGRLGLFQTPDLEFGKDTRSCSRLFRISHQTATFLSLIFQVLTLGRGSVTLPSP